MVDQNWRPSRSTDAALATVKLGHVFKRSKKIVYKILPAIRPAIGFLKNQVVSGDRGSCIESRVPGSQQHWRAIRGRELRVVVCRWLPNERLQEMYGSFWRVVTA